MKVALESLMTKLVDPKYEPGRFFRTGPGDYAEGEQFLGIRVPHLRVCLKDFIDSRGGLTTRDIPEILEVGTKLKHNEYRLASIMMLEHIVSTSLKESNVENAQLCFKAYVDNIPVLSNNWNLVDTGAPGIVGNYFLWQLQQQQATSAKKGGGKKKKATTTTPILDRNEFIRTMATKPNLWERRVAVVCTLPLIRSGVLDDTLLACELLLPDTHDLIHKACGWMLREVGKQDEAVMLEFLRKHKASLAPTAMRYALERTEGSVKNEFLNKKRVRKGEATDEE
eukprot:PhF_6_TR31688/c0_g1_i2/m.46624